MKSDFMKPQLKTTPDHEIRFHETPIKKQHQIMKSDSMNALLHKTLDHEINPIS